jgi:hypothetical protein
LFAKIGTQELRTNSEQKKLDFVAFTPQKELLISKIGAQELRANNY